MHDRHFSSRLSHEYGRRMRGGWRVWAPVAIFVLFGPLLSACSAGSDGPHGELRIAAGEQDSAYYLYGNALAGLVRQAWPEVQPKMIITKTSQENLQKVRVGEAPSSEATSYTWLGMDCRPAKISKAV